MKTKLARLLDAKGHEIWSVGPGDSVYRAIQLMAEKGIGLLLVMDEGRPVGVISERDYARRIILEGRSSRDTAVSEIMTRDIVFGHPRQTVQEALGVMTEKHFRHLPVLDEDRVVGILSIGDLVKRVIEDQRFHIEQLEGYITS